ncbi:MAG: glycosyl hydrolase family 67 [Spirochaetes bacterium]|nr:glycosyl hydrolase family 67 [Spirochaetota bacterium]
MKRDFLIIDSLTPFIKESKEKFINWSKIPYYLLEKKGEVNDKIFKRIFKNYKVFIKKVKKMGYNSVSLDDLAHLTIFKFYPEKLKNKIKDYRKKINLFIKYAVQKEMKVFINSDIMFYNRYIKRFIMLKKNSINILFDYAVKKVLKKFNKISGIIVRIGESDGIDVNCDFKSRMLVKSPLLANKFIKEILPVFEENKKYLIFRTWTTGAYKIGDLMWNRKTFNKTFKNINSDYFIISMKYGNADFFRYLELNPLFNETKIKKIVELQTRREYEGFGEYPSFTGYDYYEYYKKLKDNSSFCGIYVWCQTGGWSSFKNFTFLKDSSFWNELNTFTVIKIFNEDRDPEDAACEYFKGKNKKLFKKFLRHSGYAVKNLLYDPFFSKNEYYFNKLRIPPLIHIFWQNCTLTNLTVMLYRILNGKGKLSLKKGYKSLLKLKEMKAISKKLNLPYNYKFHFDTFKIFYMIRKIIYRGYTIKNINKLYEKIKEYKKNHKTRYYFYINIKHRIGKMFYKIIFRLLIRKRKKYRIIDKMLFNPFFSKILLLFYFLMRKNFPEFTDTQAMPFSTFLK